MLRGQGGGERGGERGEEIGGERGEEVGEKEWSGGGKEGREREIGVKRSVRGVSIKSMDFDTKQKEDSAVQCNVMW